MWPSPAGFLKVAVRNRSGPEGVVALFNILMKSSYPPLLWADAAFRTTRSLVVIVLLLLAEGCAHAPLPPPPPPPPPPVAPPFLACSLEAITATAELSIPRNARFSVNLLSESRRGKAIIIENGLIQATLEDAVRKWQPSRRQQGSPVQSDEEGLWRVLLPKKARLSGVASVDGQRVQIRFDRLHFPNGKIRHFCGIAYELSTGELGLPKNDPDLLMEFGIYQPEPGTAVINNGNIEVHPNGIPSGILMNVRPELGYVGSQEP